MPSNQTRRRFLQAATLATAPCRRHQAAGIHGGHRTGRGQGDAKALSARRAGRTSSNDGGAPPRAPPPPDRQRASPHAAAQHVASGTQTHGRNSEGSHHDRYSTPCIRLTLKFIRPAVGEKRRLAWRFPVLAQRAVVDSPRWMRARWENARLPFQLLREKERHYGARRVIDQDALEKVQCLCFSTQYLRHFDVQVLNCWETTLHENR